jgi:hypothetical protein
MQRENRSEAFDVLVALFQTPLNPETHFFSDAALAFQRLDGAELEAAWDMLSPLLARDMRAVLTVLSRQAEPRVMTALAEARRAPDVDPAVAAQIDVTLSAHGDATAWDRVVRVLGTASDLGVVRAALRALRDVPTKRSFELADAFMNHDEPSVRGMAYDTLFHMLDVAQDDLPSGSYSKEYRAVTNPYPSLIIEALQKLRPVFRKFAHQLPD